MRWATPSSTGCRSGRRDGAVLSESFESPALLAGGMPQLHLDEETVERLDSLRVEDESYDEIVSELINIYEAEELALFRTGDEV